LGNKSLLLQQSIFCFASKRSLLLLTQFFQIAAEQQQCSQIVQMMMPHQPFLHGKDMMICISSWREPVNIQTLWVQQQQQLVQQH
jgi:hypothetical protein